MWVKNPHDIVTFLYKNKDHLQNNIQLPNQAWKTDPELCIHVAYKPNIAITHV